MLRLFSYSFTASDGSEESTIGRVVSPCSIMVHHGFTSKETRRARKQKYRLRQTSHSSVLVARQGDPFSKLYQAVFLVDSFKFNFVDEERSDIYEQSQTNIQNHKERPSVACHFNKPDHFISDLECIILKCSTYDDTDGLKEDQNLIRKLKMTHTTPYT